MVNVARWLVIVNWVACYLDPRLVAANGGTEHRCHVPGGYRWQTTGQRLKEARDQAGLTQEGVADRLGVTWQTVWYWEAGRSRPSTDRLVALARLYGVTMDWLLGMEHLPQPDDMYAKVEMALRSASQELSPEDMQSILDFVSYMRDRRRS
ncbi:MAG: helix-turn-helix transcriptional regulator [Chloroflexi bacterium]|nr:helix-turn-helix transcriptional regulator [Chloroflexota bacterium]